jgi:outer membrane biosynthesis protein TonB
MKKLIIASTALVLASAAGAQPADTFKRPDCSAYQGTSHLPESRCFRKTKLAVRYANYAALQKTGLEFAYLGRPVSGKELDKAYPEAKKAAEDKVEGEFLINFSVNTEGNVYDVKIVNSTSAPIGHLAKLWADTIAQWKFVKIAKPVTNVPFRRLYLYSSEDDDKSSRKSGG